MLPDDKHRYLTAVQLAATAGVSESTIWRLKKAGKIPFFQPGGEDCLVKFPPDAFEQQRALKTPTAEDTDQKSHQQINADKNHLPGRRPTWRRKLSRPNNSAVDVTSTE
jgi:hypothetical protein